MGTAKVPYQLPDIPARAGGTGTVMSAPSMADLSRSACRTISRSVAVIAQQAHGVTADHCRDSTSPPSRPGRLLYLKVLGVLEVVGLGFVQVLGFL
jgi:hypothetical protein